jgi:hypothetical protein
MKLVLSTQPEDMRYSQGVQGVTIVPYISADVYTRVFTSAKIQYYRMQWSTMVLVFPTFPTLL